MNIINLDMIKGMVEDMTIPDEDVYDAMLNISIEKLLPDKEREKLTEDEFSKKIEDIGNEVGMIQELLITYRPEVYSTILRGNKRPRRLVQ